MNDLIDTRWLSNLKEKYPPMHYFDKLKPMFSEPAPAELIQFRNSSRTDKAAAGARFFMQDFMVEYLDKKWKCELHNRANYEWCKQLLLEILPKDDYGTRKKVAEKMYEFVEAIEKTNNPFPAFKIDWSKEPKIEEYNKRSDEMQTWDE